MAPRAAKRAKSEVEAQDQKDVLRAKLRELRERSKQLESASQIAEKEWWAKKREMREFSQSTPQSVKEGWDKRFPTIVFEPQQTREFEIERENARHEIALRAINEQHDYLDRMAAFRRELDALPHAVRDAFEAVEEEIDEVSEKLRLIE